MFKSPSFFPPFSISTRPLCDLEASSFLKSSLEDEDAPSIREVASDCLGIHFIGNSRAWLQVDMKMPYISTQLRFKYVSRAELQSQPTHRCRILPQSSCCLLRRLRPSRRGTPCLVRYRIDLCGRYWQCACLSCIQSGHPACYSNDRGNPQQTPFGSRRCQFLHGSPRHDPPRSHPHRRARDCLSACQRLGGRPPCLTMESMSGSGA